MVVEMVVEIWLWNFAIKNNKENIMSQNKFKNTVGKKLYNSYFTEEKAFRKTKLVSDFLER